MTHFNVSINIHAHPPLVFGAVLVCDPGVLAESSWIAL